MSVNKNRFVVWALNEGELAIKTFSFSLFAELGASKVGLFNVPWGTTLGVAGSAGLLALLSKVGTLPWFSVDAKGNIEIVADEPTVIAGPVSPAAPAELP